MRKWKTQCLTNHARRLFKKIQVFQNVKKIYAENLNDYFESPVFFYDIVHVLNGELHRERDQIVLGVSTFFSQNTGVSKISLHQVIKWAKMET